VFAIILATRNSIGGLGKQSIQSRAMVAMAIVTCVFSTSQSHGLRAQDIVAIGNTSCLSYKSQSISNQTSNDRRTYTMRTPLRRLLKHKDLLDQPTAFLVPFQALQAHQYQ